MIRLPFLTKSNKNSNKFLTININSSSVKCLAFYQENSKAKVIGVGNYDLEPGSVRSGAIIDRDNVETGIEIAATMATENSEDDINSAIVGVNGDLCLGLMTTIRAKRSVEVPITTKELNSLYNKMQEAAYMQAQNEYLEITGNTDNSLEVITSSKVYTKLDNQYISSLENKPGSVVEVAVFNAFTPTFYIKSIEQVMKKNKINVLAMGSEMYALVRSITIANPDLSDFVLIDIAGDSTNVGVVFGGGILSTRTLNIGNTHFIEGISERMGLTLRDSERILKSYISEQLTQSESSIVQRSLQEILDIWIAGIEILFSEYTGVKTFAPKILLTGEGSNIADLWDTITEEPWTKSIPFKSPPEFKKLSFTDFNKIADATGKVTTADWIPNASLSIMYLEMEGLLG